MTTTVLPRGRQMKIRPAYETAYGVSPGGNFPEHNVYSFAFNRERPLVDDDVLGAGFANLVDARPAAPNVEDASGKMSVPLDMGQIGFHLGAMLGRVSATGTTPKSHAFVSGNAAVPSLYIERELVAAAQYEAGAGIVYRSMKFPLGPAAGYHQVDIDFVGSKILEPYASTAAGTPAVETLAARTPKSVGLIKVATVQIGAILSGDMTVTNEIQLDRYVGDAAYPSLAALVSQSVEFNLTARYNTDALRAYGSLGANPLPTAQRFDIEYTNSANSKLTLSCLNVRCEPVDLETQNGNAMTVTIKGRAELDASNPMLSATLLNAHVTY